MLKKKVLMLMVGLLAFGSTAGAVYAKGDDNRGNGKKAQAEATAQADGSKLKIELEVEGEATVTGDTYGEGKGKGKNGHRGLLNAIENVKDKPAGAVLADLLLTKYEAKLTPEMKAQLEAIVAKDEALTVTADLLEQQGSVTEAVYVQQEAVKANVKNLQSYKKLGKLYEKIGKTGVKLYVNGEEPSFEVAPFIKDGVTLVPFRAIAEALNALVSWNGDEFSVTVTRGDVTVKLYVGQTTAYVNGVAQELEVPAEIVDGSTVVPVRFLSESMDSTVEWEGETESVVIYEE